MRGLQQIIRMNAEKKARILKKQDEKFLAQFDRDARDAVRAEIALKSIRYVN